MFQNSFEMVLKSSVRRLAASSSTHSSYSRNPTAPLRLWIEEQTNAKRMLDSLPAEVRSRNSLRCSLRTEDSPEEASASDASVKLRSAKILHLLCRKRKYPNPTLSNPQEHGHAGRRGMSAEEVCNNQNCLFLSPADVLRNPPGLSGGNSHENRGCHLSKIWYQEPIPASIPCSFFLSLS